MDLLSSIVRKKDIEMYRFSLLLTSIAEHRRIFWCIERYSGRWTLSCTHQMVCEIWTAQGTLDPVTDPAFKELMGEAEKKKWLFQVENYVFRGDVSNVQGRHGWLWLELEWGQISHFPSASMQSFLWWNELLCHCLKSPKGEQITDQAVTCGRDPFEIKPKDTNLEIASIPPSWG